MTVQTALAAAASLVALAFSMSTFERWLARRRRHELAWSVALGLFTVASGALWVGATVGWSGPTFRVFYLFGAIVDVPVLGLGTVYLLARPRHGDRATAIVGLVGAFAAGVVLAAPLRHAVPVHRLPRGSEVFGLLPRLLAAVASSAGTGVVVGGAAWSAWRLWRTRRGSRHLVTANVLIAVGTLVLGAGGLLNSVLDEMEGFAIALVAGVSVIYAGFLMATAEPAFSRPAAPAPGRVTTEAVILPDVVNATPAEAASQPSRAAASRRR